jgi:hypothetical protein
MSIDDLAAFQLLVLDISDLEALMLSPKVT